jgi:hypothetical protein
MHHTDSHRPPCRCRECSNQYCVVYIVVVFFVVVVIVIIIAIAVASVVFATIAAAVVAVIAPAIAVAITTATTARLCCSRRWLVVALLSAVRFCHRTPSCDRRRSHCRPLFAANRRPSSPPPPLPLPPGRHRLHRHHCGQTRRHQMPKKEATAAVPPSYQRQHQREFIYKSR